VGNTDTSGLLPAEVDWTWRHCSTLGYGSCPGNEGVNIRNLFQSGKVEALEVGVEPVNTKSAFVIH
jgi:hypothetical protein